MFCFSGVHTYALRRRLIAWSSYATRLAFRSLHVSRSYERQRNLMKFVEKVDGFKYGYGYI